MADTPNYDTSVLKSDFGAGADFGHRDYTEARKAGFTNDQILSHLEDNPDLLIGKNVIGGGGLYDEIKNNAVGRNTKEGDNNPHNTDWGWLGNDNSYNKNAGYITIEDSAPVAEAKERVQNYKETYQDFEPGEHPFYKYDETHEHYKGDATSSNKNSTKVSSYNKNNEDKDKASTSFFDSSSNWLTARNRDRDD